MLTHEENGISELTGPDNGSENHKMHKHLICVCHKMLILCWCKMLNHMKCYNSSCLLNK